MDPQAKPSSLQEVREHGASETRTRDLLGAIQALSQLSYSPGRRHGPHGERESNPALATARGRPRAERRVVKRSRRADTLVTGDALSFRARLIIFFLLIVMVPMTAVGVLVIRLIDDNRSG